MHSPTAHEAVVAVHGLEAELDADEAILRTMRAMNAAGSKATKVAADGTTAGVDGWQSMAGPEEIISLEMLVMWLEADQDDAKGLCAAVQEVAGGHVEPLSVKRSVRSSAATWVHVNVSAGCDIACVARLKGNTVAGHVLLDVKAAPQAPLWAEMALDPYGRLGEVQAARRAEEVKVSEKRRRVREERRRVASIPQGPAGAAAIEALYELEVELQRDEEQLRAMQETVRKRGEEAAGEELEGETLQAGLCSPIQ